MYKTYVPRRRAELYYNGGGLRRWQEKEAALEESSARLGTATRALQALSPVIVCVVCEYTFDNKDRRLAFLDPCRHMCVDLSISRMFV